MYPAKEYRVTKNNLYKAIVRSLIIIAHLGQKVNREEKSYSDIHNIIERNNLFFWQSCIKRFTLRGIVL